jgi:hypothetical protein
MDMLPQYVSLLSRSHSCLCLMASGEYGPYDLGNVVIYQCMVRFPSYHKFRWKCLIAWLLQWQRRGMYTSNLGHVSRKVRCTQTQDTVTTTAHACLDGVSWSSSGILPEFHLYVSPLYYLSSRR